MARGWESKAVEAQQEEGISDAPKELGQPTPEQVAARRRRDELVLMRKKLEHDLEVATNPRHRQMLEHGIADLEQKLRAME
jgi:hypothetical protein